MEKVSSPFLDFKHYQGNFFTLNCALQPRSHWSLTGNCEVLQTPRVLQVSVLDVELQAWHAALLKLVFPLFWHGMTFTTPGSTFQLHQGSWALPGALWKTHLSERVQERRCHLKQLLSQTLLMNRDHYSAGAKNDLVVSELKKAKFCPQMSPALLY